MDRQIVLHNAHRMMKRRDLIALLGGAAVAWPGIIRAAAAIPHVAFLAVGFGADTTAFDAIRDALRNLGDVEGQTFVPEAHTSDNATLIPQMAAQIVAANPAVIVTINALGVPDLLKLTQTIPIVVAFTGDPVALGFSKSVGRPTGNVTGMLTLQDVLLGKRIELLGQLVGPLKRVGLIYDTGNRSHDLILSAAKSRENATGVKVVPLAVSSRSDIATVLDRNEARELDGVIVAGSPIIVTYRATLIAAAIARRLATVHDFSFEVEDGALASYGPEPAEYFQRAAEYTDRLLHGAKIADLPFESPRTFRLSLNQRTARSLGLDIPPTLLARADEVIE
jgi:putative tryptophan/tyrosine transport system substrate-binding protein